MGALQAVISNSNNEGVGKNLTCILSPPSRTGDLALMIVHCSGNTVTFAPDDPSWVALDGSQPRQGGASNTLSWIYKKVLSSGDAGSSITGTFSGAAQWEVAIIVIRNAVVDNVVYAPGFGSVGSNSTLSGTTHAVPAYTPGVADCLAVLFAGMTTLSGTGDMTTLPPGGWTEQADECSDLGGNETSITVDTVQLVGQSGIAQAPSTQTSTQAHRANVWIVTLAPVAVPVPAVQIFQISSGSWKAPGGRNVAPGQPGALPLMVGLDISTNAPSSGTMLGEATAARALFGTMGFHTKFFDGSSGINAALASKASSTFGSTHGEQSPVICIKAINDGDINAWMDGLTDTSWLCYQQEADRVSSPAVTTPGFEHLDALRQAHPNGHFVKLLLSLTSFKQVDDVAATTAAGLTWQQFLTPLIGVIDCVGSDTYVTPNYKPTWKPASFLSWLIAAANMGSCAWSLPEFGVQVSHTGTENDTANVLQRTLDYLATNNAAWINYWWASGNNGDWRHASSSPLTVILQNAVTTAVGL